MPVTSPIIPEKTAIRVVDMQNDFVQEGAPIEMPRARAMVYMLLKLGRNMVLCSSFRLSPELRA